MLHRYPAIVAAADDDAAPSTASSAVAATAGAAGAAGPTKTLPLAQAGYAKEESGTSSSPSLMSIGTAGNVAFNVFGLSSGIC